MQMLAVYLLDRLRTEIGATIMDKIMDGRRFEKETEAIDDYFECTSFCSIEESMSDCQTICMERFLKGNYF